MSTEQGTVAQRTRELTDLLAHNSVVVPLPEDCRHPRAGGAEAPAREEVPNDRQKGHQHDQKRPFVTLVHAVALVEVACATVELNRDSLGVRVEFDDLQFWIKI